MGDKIISSQHTPGSCQGVKVDGSKCAARRLAVSRFCFFHDPEKSAERAAAQRTGGLKNKLAVLPATAPDARLFDSRDVIKLMTETINQVRRGEVDPKIANAVGYLGGLILRALHDGEIEKRLAVLETAIKTQRTTQEIVFDEDYEHSLGVENNGNS